MYSLVVAFAGIFLVEGGIWGALYFASTTLQSPLQAQYPYGIYDPNVVALINFGNYAMPLIIIASAGLMLFISIQREKGDR